MRPLNVSTLILLSIVMLIDSGCRRRGQADKDYDRRLRAGEAALVEVDRTRLPTFDVTQSNKQGLLAGIEHSLKYLKTPTAKRQYPLKTTGITHAEVVQGLERFRELLNQNLSPAAFNQRMRAEFKVMQSVGWDGKGTVLFTGYYTPIFQGSRQQTAVYKYPIYKRPADLIPVGKFSSLQKLPDGSTRPYPGRRELMKSDVLKGLELVYLKEPFDPYIIQIQGSGKIELPDGSMMEVNNHSTTGHRYVSISDQLIADGKIPSERRSLATVRAYFRANPQDVDRYTELNPRFVFFSDRSGGPFGSIGVPVTRDVTIATDKAIFPPGALSFVTTKLGAGRSAVPYNGFRLDQDTGGAIEAPGRCDLFMGEGRENSYIEQKAGTQLHEGQLYYLLAR